MSDRSAQTPEEAAPPAAAPLPEAAGGMGAIRATVQHLHAETGILRGARALLAMNQASGFDCPGCAWPEAARGEDRSALEFCENGAKALAAEATRKRADAAFFAAHDLADLSARSDHWLGEQGRLVEPMLLREGELHYRPISWDEAFALVGRTLRALETPDQAVFYTSGRTSNEAAFLYQLFVRRLGTNNLPDCSNMCHESSGWAMRETLGVGKGTVQLEDFELADAIFVIGQNPGTNHPRMLTTLQAAARRGCRIVSINPLPEPGLARFKHPQSPLELLGRGTPLATLHLPVRINGDVALMQGIMKEMLEEDERRRGTVLDRAFIAEHCEGFEELAAALRAARWEDLVEESGISRAQMREAAEIAWNAPRIIACWAMGLTQHQNAVANIQEVVNFLLLRGNVGRPGAGACPVRGHSNVQGDRTMGIWEQMDQGFLDRLGQRFGFTPPPRHGLDTVGAIAAMAEGRARVFVGMGGNFLSATPDTDRTAQGLRRCLLTVHVSTKLNRAHLVTGREALILPCLGRSEEDRRGPERRPQFVTVEDSMGVVHASRGTLPPASPALLSEPAIVAGLAQAALDDDGGGIAWRWLVEDYDRIRDQIGAVVTGFAELNRRLAAGGGSFVLPNPARERRFPTAGGRARFTVHALAGQRLGDGELMMMTIRSHDQFNTTIYGLDDRYRGVRGGRRVVFMNQDDMAARGLAAGELVDLHSHFRGETRSVRRFVALPHPIPSRCAATYFPEANPLVPLDSVAEKSRTPASKSVVITVTRSVAD